MGALTCDDALGGFRSDDALDGVRMNILDAALCHRGDEFLLDDTDSPDFYDNINNERIYLCESPKLLCRELVKLGLKPMLVESMLDHGNHLFTSLDRALYVQAALEAGLIQELRTVRRGQQ